jgi:phosphomannomutase
VIGYDHRKAGSITSERFAIVAAQACLLKGVKTFLYSRIVATPLVPFGVKQLGAAAGIMVTASHNPKEDNGYKVYWTNSAQIIPPVDAGIASAIAENLEPWDEAAYKGVSDDAVRANDLVVDPEAALNTMEEYFSSAKAQIRLSAEVNGATAPVTYTAMHGVGKPFVLEAFRRAGLPAPIEVAEQVEPDPTFPTVEFPNPEEGAGALKLSMAAAERAGCTLILANDPDADRLAVAERSRVTGAGDKDWYVFSGNEIGCLLADWLLRCLAREKGLLAAAADGGDDAACLAASLATPPHLGDDVVVLATTVSSKAIRAVAKHYGASFDETLTGFKWIGNRALSLREEGKTVVLGIEEAIGFCIGDVVLDKDGVCAAAVFAEMAGSLARSGESCLGRLARLRQTTGFFVSCNKYIRVSDAATISAIFEAFRAGGRYALRIGDFGIADVRDLTGKGLDTAQADGRPLLPTSSAQMITITFRNGCVVTLRTSGTEPKLKWYAELSKPSPEPARDELRLLMTALFDHVLTPEAFGIPRPAIDIIG